jgi:hypothetical protein
VAIENWQHDFNIGTVVRNANAFLARGGDIVGLRRWNRRGAMVTDRKHDVRHHPTIDDFAAWAEAERPPVIGIDNLLGARLVDTLPRRCAPGSSTDATQPAPAEVNAQAVAGLCRFA